MLTDDLAPLGAGISTDTVTGIQRYVASTVYPKKYAHGFVVLCFVVVMQSFIMNSHEVFIHIHQGCFPGTGAIVRLPQCQRSKPDGYGKISQCITTTKHSKAKTVCIFLGIYCRYWTFRVKNVIHICRFQGLDSIWRFLTSTGDLNVEIRRSYDHLFSTMGFPILVRWHIYVELILWHIVALCFSLQQ